MSVAVSVSDARELTDRIKVAVEGVWHLIVQAYESRAWAALDYESWDAYCAQEFGTSRLRLPREERREVVASLREAGLSQRAIAAATGDSRKAIRNDLAAGGPKGPVQILKQATVGTNGQVYVVKPMERLTEAAKKYPDKSRVAVGEREQIVREMAEAGYHKTQIAERLGVVTETVNAIANRIGVTVRANAVLKHATKQDSVRIMNEMVMTLDGLAMSFDVVKFDALPEDDLDYWIEALGGHGRLLGRFVKQLKEARG